jgi:hypothetical protein
VAKSPKKSAKAKKPSKAAPKKPTKPKKLTKTTTAKATKSEPTKPKAAAKPKKAEGAGAFSLRLDGGGGGVPAAPNITTPTAGPVTALIALPVSATTVRGDLDFIIELRDMTAVPPAVVFQKSVPTPGANPITGTVPAGTMVASRQFRLRVFVDPAEGQTPLPDSAVLNVST